MSNKNCNLQIQDPYGNEWFSYGYPMTLKQALRDIEKRVNEEDLDLSHMEGGTLFGYLPLSEEDETSFLVGDPNFHEDPYSSGGNAYAMHFPEHLAERIADKFYLKR